MESVEKMENDANSKNNTRRQGKTQICDTNANSKNNWHTLDSEHMFMIYFSRALSIIHLTCVFGCVKDTHLIEKFLLRAQNYA